MRKLTNFKEGDKVWIERTDFVENVDMIRNVQTIESIIDVPVTIDDDIEVLVQSINIVGSAYLYDGGDLRLADEYQI